MDAWLSAVRPALCSLLPQDHTQDSANHTTGALLWGPRVTGDFCFSACGGNLSLTFRHTPGHIKLSQNACLFFSEDVSEYSKTFALFICLLKQDLV